MAGDQGEHDEVIIFGRTSGSAANADRSANRSAKEAPARATDSR